MELGLAAAGIVVAGFSPLTSPIMQLRHSAYRSTVDLGIPHRDIVLLGRPRNGPRCPYSEYCGIFIVSPSFIEDRCA